MDMKRFAGSCAALLLPLLLLAGPSAQEAHAQAAFGVQGNYGTEADLGIGARGLINIPNVNLEAVGSFDVFFPDGDRDWLDVNANVFYHFHVPEGFTPYLGGGLNVARISNGGSESEVGLNLGGGVRFDRPGVTPFLEARAVLSDADQLVITGGFLFGPTHFR